jgi:hypothetical protein
MEILTAIAMVAALIFLLQQPATFDVVGRKRM